MRLGPEGHTVGAESRVTNVSTPIPGMGQTGARQDQLAATCRKVIVVCQNFSLGGRPSLHDG